MIPRDWHLPAMDGIDVYMLKPFDCVLGLAC